MVARAESPAPPARRRASSAGDPAPRPTSPTRAAIERSGRAARGERRRAQPPVRQCRRSPATAVPRPGPRADIEQMCATNGLGTIYTVSRHPPPHARPGPRARRRHLLGARDCERSRAPPCTAGRRRSGAGFAEALRHELSGTGVSVTTVLPGEVETELHDHQPHSIPDWRRGDEGPSRRPTSLRLAIEAVEADRRSVDVPARGARCSALERGRAGPRSTGVAPRGCAATRPLRGADPRQRRRVWRAAGRTWLAGPIFASALTQYGPHCSGNALLGGAPAAGDRARDPTAAHDRPSIRQTVSRSPTQLATTVPSRVGSVCVAAHLSGARGSMPSARHVAQAHPSSSHRSREAEIESHQVLRAVMTGEAPASDPLE